MKEACELFVKLYVLCLFGMAILATGAEIILGNRPLSWIK